MKVLCWGVCAIAALLMTAGSSFATESEKDAMQAAMDQMKQEVDAIRSTMSADREAMRESAGGAPEALRSKGGNATVRIGGKVAVRYDLRMTSNDVDENPTGGTANPSSLAATQTGAYGGGEYSNQNGFTIDTASVTFDFQINEDLSAFIDVRPGSFDKAYFQWNNIGGTGLGAQIGYIGIPGGMYSASWSPAGSVLMMNPATKSPGDLFGYNTDTNLPAGVSSQEDTSAVGIKLYYELDQFKITAALHNNDGIGAVNSTGAYSGGDATSWNGEIRNGGLDHVIMLEFNPAFMEGLHFSFTYSGSVDTSQGVSGTTDPILLYRGSSYSPDFDLGVAYVGDKFSVWTTANFNLNPGFYSDSYEYGISLGANYNITDRLSIGASFDYAQLTSGNDVLKRARGMTENPIAASGFLNDGYDYEMLGGRVQVGAKYTFCNGVWLKANYGHGLFGHNVADRDHTRSYDRLIIETGVGF